MDVLPQKIYSPAGEVTVPFIITLLFPYIPPPITIKSFSAGYTNAPEGFAHIVFVEVVAPGFPVLIALVKTVPLVLVTELVKS